jgi:hypothetical protein
MSHFATSAHPVAVRRLILGFGALGMAPHAMSWGRTPRAQPLGGELARADDLPCPPLDDHHSAVTR